ncbi:MAG TPA: lysophospholipid acyltransferase family protein [Gammaproteobacteria bacterium]|nr:lysophospholipid acyltransferase family protein [Gammaproteobacteria bacterium]
MAKVSKIHVLWIMLKTIYISLKYSVASMRVTARPDIDRIARQWSKDLLACVDVHYTIHNPHQVQLQPNRPYILMSNHASHYDIPLILLSVPGSIRMISKKEIFRIPIWGYILRRAEFLTIERNNPQQAIKDLELVKEKMQSGIIPWIAPEGTRSRHGKLNPFKKGAFMLALQTQALIIPIGIRGSGNILPPDTWDFNIGQDVEIHINPPIDTTNYSITTRNELISAVRQSIQEASGMPD